MLHHLLQLLSQRHFYPKEVKKTWPSPLSLLLIFMIACVASVSVRFRSKERGTRVKDRAKNGSSKRAGRGRGSFLPSPPPTPLSFFGFCFISRAAKTVNPVSRSFFAPKPNGNTCYAGNIYDQNISCEKFDIIYVP